MNEQQAHPKPRGHALWNERDEIQRLDFVAGVVAPTSLAGCVACAALISTDHLVEAANYTLGGAGLLLLGCAVMATVSLNWSPWEAVQDDKTLVEVIARKRFRTKTALAGLVLTVLLGFGATAVMELAAHSGDGHAEGRRHARPDGYGSQRQRIPGAVRSQIKPGLDGEAVIGDTGRVRGYSI